MRVEVCTGSGLLEPALKALELNKVKVLTYGTETLWAILPDAPDRAEAQAFLQRMFTRALGRTAKLIRYPDERGVL